MSCPHNHFPEAVLPEPQAPSSDADIGFGSVAESSAASAPSGLPGVAAEHSPEIFVSARLTWAIQLRRCSQLRPRFPNPQPDHAVSRDLLLRRRALTIA